MKKYYNKYSFWSERVYVQTQDHNWTVNTKQSEKSESFL